MSAERPLLPRVTLHALAYDRVERHVRVWCFFHPDSLSTLS